MTTVPAKIDPRLVMEIHPDNARSRMKKVAASNWVPVPTAAQNRQEFVGNRKTSPWINFQPDFRTIKIV